MNDELRFDDKVVIVTGAGRGLGRAYARLLAARGASVVVNDLGSTVDGDGSDPATATAVVAEIIAAGGVAVADGNDVSQQAGAEALVATAVGAFGAVDAVINNAGIMRWAAMPTVSADDLAAHLAVHLGATFHTTRAAWPYLVACGAGRVVVTTSSGIFGHPANTAYAAAKGAVVGFMRSVALAGARRGIAVNAIAPAAQTRMAVASTDGDDGPDAEDEMAPELAAPMAAYLAHRACPANGQIYTAGGGRFSRVVLATNEGYLHSGSTPTIEDVAANWTGINDLSDLDVPTDLMGWSGRFLLHLDSHLDR